MRWRKGKPDRNQARIVSALRAVGCSVVVLSGVGDGVPDLLVGYRGRTLLLEVKDPNGRNRVEPVQEEWAKAWRGGPVAVVRSADEALAAAGA